MPHHFDLLWIRCTTCCYDKLYDRYTANRSNGVGGQTCKFARGQTFPRMNFDPLTQIGDWLLLSYVSANQAMLLFRVYTTPILGLDVIAHTNLY